MTKPHTLPEDWQPTPGDINYASSQGLSEIQATAEAQDFKNHFTNGPGCNTKWKQWSGGNGAWGTWVRKAYKWPGWRVEKAEQEQQAERKQEEADQMALGLERASKERRRPVRRPKIKPVPFAGKRLTDEERNRLRQQIYDAEIPSRPPPPTLGPAHVPMPEHLRGRILAPKEKQ